MSFARDERVALCALLDETGPEAPTLCKGWQTLDLAAHLVLRERRPDAAAGVMGGPLAGHTERVRRMIIARTPYQQLVDEIRNGPPRLSVFSVPGMDERLNTVEYFVHHEDVRRGADGWEPRDIGAGLTDLLWQRLRVARLLFRKAPVGIELVRDDVPAGPGRQRVRITAKARTPMVTVTGGPAELTLWALGRTAAARVRLDGSEPDVRKLTQADWRV
ncbi:MAG TPA: TIGR03085 family metal-binding protein [Streptosporangiaceae bacterium]|nr:TIGR03085 family metal-binding protein [Streptosporangiaceae bacterium]